MEYQLINGPPEPSRKYKVSTIILFILFIGTLVAISILAFEYSKLKNKNSPSPGVS